jgi:hypothetical protein
MLFRCAQDRLLEVDLGVGNGGLALGGLGLRDKQLTLLELALGRRDERAEPAQAGDLVAPQRDAGARPRQPGLRSAQPRRIVPSVEAHEGLTATDGLALVDEGWLPGDARAQPVRRDRIRAPARGRRPCGPDGADGQRLQQRGGDTAARCAEGGYDPRCHTDQYAQEGPLRSDSRRDDEAAQRAERRAPAEDG